MAGLVPAIHAVRPALALAFDKARASVLREAYRSCSIAFDVDGRDKPAMTLSRVSGAQKILGGQNPPHNPLKRLKTGSCQSGRLSVRLSGL